MSNKLIRRILITLLIFICAINLFFCFLLTVDTIKKVYINEDNKEIIQELLAKDLPDEDINNISAVGHQFKLHNSTIYIYNLSNEVHSINVNDNNDIGYYVSENGESINEDLIDFLSLISKIIIFAVIIYEIIINIKKLKNNKKETLVDTSKKTGVFFERINKFFIKVRTKILFYVIIYALIYGITKIVLNQCNLEYMQWVNFISSIVFLVGGIAGTIQILKKENISIIMIIFLEIILILIIIGGSFFVIISLHPETITYKDGSKMVKGAPLDLWENSINYYEYKNIFIRGKNVRIKDKYDDYISEHEYIGTEYYDENGKKLYTTSKYVEQEINNNISINLSHEKEDDEDKKLIESINPEDILYEKEINKKVKIQVIHRGAVLGQKSLIVIGKTTDEGKTWYNQLEIDDGCLTVNNDSKYVFVNENIGFINNLQTVVNNETQRGLLVTVDGGKTFENAKFMKPDFIGEQYLYIENVPYIENKVLKVKTYTLDYNREQSEIYYEFYSKDSGKTWEYDNKK